MKPVSATIALLLFFVCLSHSLRITPTQAPAKAGKPLKEALKKFGAFSTNGGQGPSTKEMNLKAEVQEELLRRVKDYRPKCYPMPNDGCRCEERGGVKRYPKDAECRIKNGHNHVCTFQKPSKTNGPSKDRLQKYGALGGMDKNGPTTKERDLKAAMQAELMARVEGYREKCYPMPKDGCRCEEKGGVKRYPTDAECRTKK
uniref:Uncharacterized protein n=1 Tax=Trichuris muris TaxID=70415 RepID=A0A5S6QIW1_TRIMR